MQSFLITLSIVIGLIFAVIDSDPKFEYTPFIASAALLATIIIAYASARRPWLWAIIVSIWVPIHFWTHSDISGSTVALVGAFVGAYYGYSYRKLDQGRAGRRIFRSRFTPKSRPPRMPQD